MPREKSDRSNVYFLSCGNLIKIGRAVNVEKRVGALRVGNPVDEFRLLGTVLGDKDEERALHRHLSQYREKGEWFRNEKPVLNIIDLVIQEGFAAAGVKVECARQLATMHPVEQRALSALSIIFTLEKVLDAASIEDLSVMVGLRPRELYSLKYRDRKKGLMMGEVERIHAAALRAVSIAADRIISIKTQAHQLSENFYASVGQTRAASTLDGSQAGNLNDEGEA